jgi:hypothetical protein
MAEITNYESEIRSRMEDLSLLKTKKQTVFADNWPMEKVLRIFRRLINSAENQEKTDIINNQVVDVITERECGALFHSVDTENWVTFMVDLVEWTRVKQFKDREDREYDKSDFKCAHERLVMFFQITGALFKKLHLFLTADLSTQSQATNNGGQEQVECDSDINKRTEYVRRILRAITVHVMLICFTAMEEMPWTERDCVESTKYILSSVLELTGCPTLKDILCGTTENFVCKMFPKGIYHELLSRMQPYLTKEFWKRNPSMVEAFHQSLICVQMPELGDYLDKVFPIILLLIDDYMTANKLIGLQCLEHLLKNTSSAELRWYGRADVLYDALFQQMYSKETPVIERTLPCLLTVLKITEMSPLNIDQPRMYGRFVSFGLL